MGSIYFLFLFFYFTKHNSLIMKQLILLFTAFLFVAGFTFPTQVTFNTISEKSNGYQVGDVAADFNLKNIDDKMISLESIQDIKGYLVVAINPNDPDLRPDDSFEEMKVRSAEKEF